MTKTHKRFNLYAISEARNVIFGIATLWIGLFHSWDLSLEPYTSNEFLIKSLKFFRGTGNVGVDMFLFLSGIGLFFSFSKDSNVVSFWKKRLMRVLPTAFLIAAFYFSFRYVNGKCASGVKFYVSRMTFTYFFLKGERVFWFISLILALYIVFPIFYKIIEKYRLVGMLGLVALIIGCNFILRGAAPGFYSMWEVALCRIPSFVIGIWAGKFVMEKKEIDARWLWLFLGIAIVMLVLVFNYEPIIKSLVPGYNKKVETMYIWMYRYEGTILGLALVVLDSYVIKAIRSRGMLNVLRNFFEFVGMYSMEYYMIYLNINAYLERIYKIGPRHKVMLYFGSFVVSLALCVMVRKVCDFFMAYMQRKPKAQPTSELGENYKWYEFLVYIGLFVVAGAVIFTGISQISSGRVLYGIAYLLIGALAVATRICLAKRISYGPLLLYILIGSLPFVFLLHRALSTKMIQTILKGGKKTLLANLLIVAVAAACIAANVIYFKKRKELFSGKKEE